MTIIDISKIWFTERKGSVTVGGVVDPERGALVYREEIEETVFKPEEGSEFHTKKITRVTSETRRLGSGEVQVTKPSKSGPKQPLLEADGGQPKGWADETSQVEANPLYSSSDYVTDFSNPLYSNRQSTAEASAIAKSDKMAMELDDMTPLVGASRDGEVDVLF